VGGILGWGEGGGHIGILIFQGKLKPMACGINFPLALLDGLHVTSQNKICLLGSQLLLLHVSWNIFE
jgi:hypothetical protein